MTNPIRHRSLPARVEIRAAEGAAAEAPGSRIIGTGAVYNEWTELWPGFRERIAPGAFRRTLDQGEAADVVALFNHDANIVLGRTLAGTLELRDSDEALAYEIEADAENRAVVDSVLRPIGRGEVRGSSFTFRIIEGGEEITHREVETDEGIRVTITERTITAAELYDVGPVTFPAYPQTAAELRFALEFGAEDARSLARQLEAASGLTRDAIRVKLGTVLEALELEPGPSGPAELYDLDLRRRRLDLERLRG